MFDDDKFVFRMMDRDEDDEDKIIGFGMPDMNGDGRLDNGDLMMLVMQQLQERMAYERGTTQTDTFETLDPESSTFVAVAVDQETGRGAAGTYNFDSGRFEVSFF